MKYRSSVQCNTVQVAYGRPSTYLSIHRSIYLFIYKSINVCLCARNVFYSFPMFGVWYILYILCWKHNASSTSNASTRDRCDIQKCAIQTRLKYYILALIAYLFFLNWWHFRCWHFLLIWAHLNIKHLLLQWHHITKTKDIDRCHFILCTMHSALCTSTSTFEHDHYRHRWTPYRLLLNVVHWYE